MIITIIIINNFNYNHNYDNYDFILIYKLIYNFRKI